jgi:hypothetical protein
MSDKIKKKISDAVFISKILLYLPLEGVVFYKKP